MVMIWPLPSTQSVMSQYLSVNKLQGIVEPKQVVFIVRGDFRHYRFLDLTITRVFTKKLEAIEK